MILNQYATLLQGTHSEIEVFRHHSLQSLTNLTKLTQLPAVTAEASLQTDLEIMKDIVSVPSILVQLL